MVGVSHSSILNAAHSVHIDPLHRNDTTERFARQAIAIVHQPHQPFGEDQTVSADS